MAQDKNYPPANPRSGSPRHTPHSKWRPRGLWEASQRALSASMRASGHETLKKPAACTSSEDKACDMKTSVLQFTFWQTTAIQHAIPKSSQRTVSVAPSGMRATAPSAVVTFPLDSAAEHAMLLTASQ